MALTLDEKTSTKSLLDTRIPIIQTPTKGKYVQVAPSSPDGVYALGMDEYVGPDGVGYVRWIERADDKGLRWRYQEHTGPEVYRDKLNGVWQQVGVTR